MFAYFLFWSKREFIYKNTQLGVKSIFGGMGCSRSYLVSGFLASASSLRLSGGW